MADETTFTFGHDGITYHVGNPQDLDQDKVKEAIQALHENIKTYFQSNKSRVLFNGELSIDTYTSNASIMLLMKDNLGRELRGVPNIDSDRADQKELNNPIHPPYVHHLPQSD